MKPREMSIGINASMLDEKPTGVGVYSFHLINNLSGILMKQQWKKLTVFTPSIAFLNRNINIVRLSRFLQSSKYGKLAAVCRFGWNNFYYPLQARKFDLLISPTTHGSFLLRNQVITIHDLLSLRYKNISAHQRFYFKYLLPILIKKAKLIIAVSENTKKDIIHFFNYPEEKIKVIYNGFDNDQYFPAALMTENIFNSYGVRNYLLAVGPTYPHKNFEMLISAYQNLDESFKEKHPLLIAGGKHKYLNFLKKLVTDSGLQKHVHFAGYVPIEMMPSLYREAFALVFPSLYEGFGIPLLEAMASGCPVITSNTSSMPEVCEDAVLYFDPLDKSSLMQCIKMLSDNETIRNELISKGVQQAKNFSWKKMSIAFDNLIKDLSTQQNKPQKKCLI